MGSAITKQVCLKCHHRAMFIETETQTGEQNALCYHCGRYHISKAKKDESGKLQYADFATYDLKEEEIFVAGYRVHPGKATIEDFEWTWRISPGEQRETIIKKMSESGCITAIFTKDKDGNLEQITYGRLYRIWKVDGDKFRVKELQFDVLDGGGYGIAWLWIGEYRTCYCFEHPGPMSHKLEDLRKEFGAVKIDSATSFLEDGTEEFLNEASKAD